MDIVLLLILFGAGAVILALSMMLTNSFVGGIEFGQAHVAVGKGAGLLLAVDLLAVAVPYGVLLALPVWWLGLVILFRIDFWQVWPLVAINWVFLVAAKFLVGLLLHGTAPVSDDPRLRTFIAPSRDRPAAVTLDRFTPYYFPQS
jgi:hypothetical protein